MVARERTNFEKDGHKSGFPHAHKSQKQLLVLKRVVPD